MESNERFGKTEPAPVRVLPPLVFDFSLGKPLLPGLGKTHVPVRILPELSGEFTPVPQVTLRLWLRPGATPAGVGADLFAFWKRLDEFDRAGKGAGIRPADVWSEQTSEGEVIQLVLALAGTGIVERGDRLRDAVNGSLGATEPWAGQSFVKWSAESTAA